MRPTKPNRPWRHRPLPLDERHHACKSCEKRAGGNEGGNVGSRVGDGYECAGTGACSSFVCVTWWRFCIQVAVFQRSAVDMKLSPRIEQSLVSPSGDETLANYFRGDHIKHHIKHFMAMQAANVSEQFACGNFFRYVDCLGKIACVQIYAATLWSSDDGSVWMMTLSNDVVAATRPWRERDSRISYLSCRRRLTSCRDPRGLKCFFIKPDTHTTTTSRALLS